MVHFSIGRGILRPVKTNLKGAPYRKFLYLTGSFCLVLWLAALAAGSQKAVASSVSLGWDAEPRTFDPRYAQDANSQYLENLLHCSLIEYGPQGEKRPSLAAKWTWLSPTSLEVTLRTDGVFSTGRPVTVQDVVATYGFFLDPKVTVPSPRKSAFAKLKSVKASAADRLIFEISEPDAAFLVNLIVGILPAELASQVPLNDPLKITGCGPFALEGQKNGQISLVPSKTYSLGPKPKIDQVQIKIVKDENTRYAKLITGELDIVQNLINRDKLSDLANKHPQLELQKRTGLTTSYLGINMRDPVLKDVRVRSAIALAIDRQKIVTHVLNGMAHLATTMLPKEDPFYFQGLKERSHQPQEAMALLDEAGYKDPDGVGPRPRLVISYKTTTDLTRISVAKAVAADLKKIGIEVKVESLEWGRFKSDVDQGKVQLWSLAWIGFKDPDIYRFAFATESFPPDGGNRGWYSRPELDQLLRQAKMEIDLAKRIPLYHEVQKIVAQDLPYIFLWHEEIFAVVNKRIKGFELYADGRLASLTQVHVEPTKP